MTAHRILILLTCLTTATLAAPPAAADVCDTGIVVYSWNEKSPIAFDPHGFACYPSDFTGVEQPADTRLITPGSELVQLRYYPPHNSGPTSLTAHIVGLGVETVVQMPLYVSYGVRISFFYESPEIAIDPLASGTFAIELYDGSRLVESTVYHTAI